MLTLHPVHFWSRLSLKITEKNSSQHHTRNLWRPISWRARKTDVTRDVGAQACVKTLTMIFVNVRAVFVRAFVIKSALLETGHVSRSQTVCLVSKRYKLKNRRLVVRCTYKDGDRR